MFILFTKIQLSLTIPGQVRTELLGLPSLGGFKGGNKKESVGLTLPEGTVFESVDSKQEVACVRDHLSHSCENSQEGFFFLECVWGGGRQGSGKQICYQKNKDAKGHIMVTIPNRT